jgi:hypothetical protein
MAKVKLISTNTHQITLHLRGKVDGEVKKIVIPPAQRSADGKKTTAATVIVDGDLLVAARKLNNGVESYFQPSKDGEDAKLKVEGVKEDAPAPAK